MNKVNTETGGTDDLVTVEAATPNTTWVISPEGHMGFMFKVYAPSGALVSWGLAETFRGAQHYVAQAIATAVRS